MDPIMLERQDIVDIDQTSVKRQAVGNCWVYATASWSESLIKAAGRGDFNISESYWTYWHWYGQIAQQRVRRISTGGSYGVISRIITNYGLMQEAAFIPSEAEAEMSLRQRSAEVAINASLTSGALATAEARANKRLVRQELDKAWGLSPTVSAQLDRAFGVDGAITLRTGAATAGTDVLRPEEVQLQYKVRGVAQQRTLAQALRDWTESYYPTSPSSQRAFQKKLQAALHEGVPAILTWFVDFNALGSEGRFEGVPAVPGRQGFHMTVAEDYEISGVPGFGTLRAGVLETRPEALQAALADEASMVKVRTKNSWGAFRSDRQFVPGFPGYHDLYMSYLNGPIKQCRQDNGETNTRDCPWSIVPLQSMIVPRAYLN